MSDHSDRRALLDDMLRQASTIDPVPTREILTARIQQHAARLALGDGNTRLSLMSIAALCLVGVATIDAQRAANARPRPAPSALAFQSRLAAGDVLPPDDAA